jgi:hypothetical protein
MYNQFSFLLTVIHPVNRGQSITAANNVELQEL